MEEFEKIKILLRHWMEHNDEHARTYKDWADKVSSSGNQELSEILSRLSDETKGLRRLFEEAVEKIVGQAPKD